MCSAPTQIRKAVGFCVKVGNCEVSSVPFLSTCDFFNGDLSWQVKTKQCGFSCSAERRMAAFATGGGLGAELKSNSILHIWRRFKRVTIHIFISLLSFQLHTFGDVWCLDRQLQHESFVGAHLFKTIFQSNKDAKYLALGIHLTLKVKGKNNKEPGLKA